MDTDKSNLPTVEEFGSFSSEEQLNRLNKILRITNNYYLVMATWAAHIR